MLIKSYDSSVLQTAAAEQHEASSEVLETVDIFFIQRDVPTEHWPLAQIFIAWAQNQTRVEPYIDTRYRKAYLHLHAHSFGLPRCNPFDLIVWYRPDVLFNIEPPDCIPGNDGEQPVVFDKLWEIRQNAVQPAREDFYDKNTFIPLPQDVKPYLPKLATGWNLRELYERCEDMRNSVEYLHAFRDIERLAWCTSCKNIYATSQLWIHPWHHRPLTLGEVAALAGYGGEISPQWLGDAPFYYLSTCYPAPLVEWLLRQCELSLSGAWGSDDWQSTYMGKVQGWQGKDTTGEKIKAFNLMNYRPMGYTVERFPQEARSQFHNWVEIQQYGNENL